MMAPPRLRLPLLLPLLLPIVLSIVPCSHRCCFAFKPAPAGWGVLGLAPVRRC